MNLSTVPESKRCERIVEDRFYALPDELLEHILSLVPTKDAIATTILSKRWRYVWTMLSHLEFKDEGSDSIGWFVEKSLQLHKAPKLERLVVKLGPHCPVDVDVGKWIDNALKRCVEILKLKLLWKTEPTSLPKSLYACDTLVRLTLSNKILVDISSSASLPSLLYLKLDQVMYKDEDSLVMLLSSSPNLNNLMVNRHEGGDNLTNYTVKVPSLKKLYYTTTMPDNVHEDDLIGSLIIDSPALKYLDISDGREDYCMMENMPCLDEAFIIYVTNHDDKFLTSLSSVIHLDLFLTESLAEFCDPTEFSRLIKLNFIPNRSQDWLKPLMFWLQSSPNLQTLMIDTNRGSHLPLYWNQPNYVPGCLSSHLEIFRWSDYGGSEGEKQLMAYILANSKCLKTVEISLISTCNLEERQKEIESMPIGSQHHLCFYSPLIWNAKKLYLGSCTNLYVQLIKPFLWLLIY